MYHIILLKDDLSCLDLCYLDDKRLLLKFIRNIPHYTKYTIQDDN